MACIWQRYIWDMGSKKMHCKKKMKSLDARFGIQCVRNFET